MKFKDWLFVEENGNFSKWKDILIGYLGLDHEHALSASLDTFDKQDLINKLEGLSEFAQLTSDQRNNVVGFIQSPASGTIGDLIRQLSSN